MSDNDIDKICKELMEIQENIGINDGTAFLINNFEDKGEYLERKRLKKSEYSEHKIYDPMEKVF